MAELKVTNTTPELKLVWLLGQFGAEIFGFWYGYDCITLGPFWTAEQIYPYEANILLALFAVGLSTGAADTAS